MAAYNLRQSSVAEEAEAAEAALPSREEIQSILDSLRSIQSVSVERAKQLIDVAIAVYLQLNNLPEELQTPLQMASIVHALAPALKLSEIDRSHIMQQVMILRLQSLVAVPCA